jgi:uncharacterized protein (DUF488 family)
MISRQKVLLNLLLEAGGEASHLHVTKWAFLLRHETASQGGKDFYEFLPYHYGPFSFALFHEAGRLVQRGVLEEVDSKIWSVSVIGKKETDGLNPTIREDVHTVIKMYGQHSSDALKKKVYVRHPWFTINSRAMPRMDRPVARSAIYTAGYEGVTIDGFLDSLLRRGIVRVVDVRNNPISRRYGYHKSTLSRLCSYIGLEYVHIPELGVESSLRRGSKTREDMIFLFSRYEEDTLLHEVSALQRAVGILREKPSVLMCMEADPSKCHRLSLAGRLALMTGLPIEHLRLVL